MGDIAEITLKIIGAILGLLGLIIVYAAPKIVEKKKLDEKREVDSNRIEGLSEEEVLKFKKDSAILDVKIKGLMVALPGFLIILIMFKM